MNKLYYINNFKKKIEMNNDSKMCNLTLFGKSSRANFFHARRSINKVVLCNVQNVIWPSILFINIEYLHTLHVTSQMKSLFFFSHKNSYFMCAEGSWFIKYAHRFGLFHRGRKKMVAIFLSQPILRSSTAWTIPFLVLSTSLKPKLFVCKLELTPEQTNACQACPVQFGFMCVRKTAFMGKQERKRTSENFSKRILHLLMMVTPG